MLNNRKKINIILSGCIVLLISCTSISSSDKNFENQFDKTFINHKNNNEMNLGAFSVSLNVKDLAVSKQFYENLGFEVLGGDMQKNYLIMKNENSLIGLFHGMFENNILTFNPGWDESGKNIDPYDDVRKIQEQLKEAGVKLEGDEIDVNTTGPASLIISDPDGNVIFIDQHR